MILKSVLSAYGLDIESLEIEGFGSGLINNTWCVKTPNDVYILQRINQAIFKKPEDIAANISLIAKHLGAFYPEYLLVSPVKNTEGGDLVIIQEGYLRNVKDFLNINELPKNYYRLFPFVKGSHSKDVVETSEQAYEAAAQFGKFTFLLRGCKIDKLTTTIPQFHDLSLRYRQFQEALEKGNKERISEAAELIGIFKENADVVTEFENIKTNPDFKLRVTHHDTKISNVLFNDMDKCLCVIDLDTVMPGYFISDVGDMMRTYLSPVSEEETDFSKIEVRDDFYKAIVRGYYNEMQNELTEAEKQHFFYAGKFMIYMQALRFLTDYLNNDVYYGEKYPKHNFFRAKNQVILLGKLIEKEALLTNLTF